MDEFGEVEGEEDPVVDNAEDETGLDVCKVKDGNRVLSRLDDCKVKDGTRVLVRVLVRVVALVEMLVVLVQATKAVTMIASEYLIVDISLDF